jgi:hypothetical protein
MVSKEDADFVDVIHTNSGSLVNVSLYQAKAYK